MKQVKTHTFKLGRYRICLTGKIGGVTDTPVMTTWKKTKKEIVIVTEKGIEGLDNALHEALHAEGIPDEFLHKKDGDTDTRRIARFLWRLGYRRRSLAR